jgi:hypothetical protein
VSLVRRYSQSDETFWRDLIFPEEKRRLYTSDPWKGGYRWFQSPNITPIEYYAKSAPVSVGGGVVPPGERKRQL